jgi:hypothetical protein
MQSPNAVSRFEIIEVPIFGSRFMICHGSEEKSQQYLAEELKYVPEDRTLLADELGKMIPLRDAETGDPIWVLRFPEGALDREVLVHELHHLTAEIAEYHGVEDRETEAYLMGWLYSSI